MSNVQETYSWDFPTIRETGNGKISTRAVEEKDERSDEHVDPIDRLEENLELWPEETDGSKEDVQE